MALSLKDQIRSLMSQFHSSPESSLNIMKEINFLMSSVPQSDVSNIVQEYQIAPLIRYVVQNPPRQKDDQEAVINFLSKLLDSISPNIVIKQFTPELILALNSELLDVKEMALKQVKRCLTDNIATSIMIQNMDLLCCVARLIGDDMCLAKLSTIILSTLGKDLDALPIIFSPRVNSEFQNLLGKGDVIRFRVYEVFVKIACCSPQALQIVIEMQYLEQLTSEIYKDDMLLLLNCVELLTNLVLVEHGLVCLQQYGFLDNLQKLLTMSLGDCLLKFFGNLGHSQPKKLFKELPKVVNIIFNLCDSNDFVLKSHAVRTLGFIGATSDGKRYLVQEGTKMEKYLQCVGDLIKGGSNEVKVDGLATMFDLIQIMDSKSPDVEDITENWFRRIISSPMTTLMAYCKSPFLDLRCGALSVLQAIASQVWGVKELASFPGFLEYLLDRSTEYTKEGKECKFGVVEVLLKSPIIENIYNTEAIMQLREFYKMGPFYVPTEASVVFEGAG
ncbi:26S proteasome non-ATPase regulatory subunit 5-like [Centruroides sculpturatus]|uniref:26S proteasome non-ATPase regulatory subunit 5-like n=1 Tax=Centruroides sculpturatus TaxID=218467 RepID=UPI000C6D58E9|nr:26S proteasome non-ATPase regulatory subunit 5-like [Centruroides sculpturatus]